MLPSIGSWGHRRIYERYSLTQSGSTVIIHPLKSRFADVIPIHFIGVLYVFVRRMVDDSLCENILHFYKLTKHSLIVASEVGHVFGHVNYVSFPA